MGSTHTENKGVDPEFPQGRYVDDKPHFYLAALAVKQLPAVICSVLCRISSELVESWCLGSTGLPNTLINPSFQCNFPSSIPSKPGNYLHNVNVTTMIIMMIQFNYLCILISQYNNFETFLSFCRTTKSFCGLEGYEDNQDNKVWF